MHKVVCFISEMICFHKKPFFVVVDKTTETLRIKKTVFANNLANKSLLNIVYHVTIHTFMCILYLRLILTSFKQNNIRCIVRRFQSPLVYISLGEVVEQQAINLFKFYLFRLDVDINMKRCPKFV